jgi:hypothetical protein
MEAVAMNTWSPTRADFDLLNERIGQLVAEGLPFSEAMGQAREDVPGWPHEDWLGDRVKLTLLRAPDDESHQHPSFQAEIKEFDAALKDGGAESEALWLTQDSVGGWCGYVGAIVATGATIRAVGPIIIAYMKRRPGRKVQVQCDGLKLKIDEPTEAEVDRILTIAEQRSTATKRQKKKS